LCRYRAVGILENGPTKIYRKRIAVYLMRNLQQFLLRNECQQIAGDLEVKHDRQQ
jgi:hypothetical protein